MADCFAVLPVHPDLLRRINDTRSDLADQSRDVGAGRGWRGVNPIRDLVRAPPDLMLIRWQTYRSKGGLYRGKTTRIRAILSMSIRVNGQSRQKFIAVIGSFVAETLDVEARRNFWKVAHERLSTCVPDDDRSRIEAALARRVPPPTAAEEAAWQRQIDERLMRREGAMT